MTLLNRENDRHLLYFVIPAKAGIQDLLPRLIEMLRFLPEQGFSFRHELINSQFLFIRVRSLLFGDRSLLQLMFVFHSMSESSLTWAFDVRCSSPNFREWNWSYWATSG